MCLERLMTEEEELALRGSWDGKTTWKVVELYTRGDVVVGWGNKFYTLGGLFPHTLARAVTLGEWVEEEDRRTKLQVENWDPNWDPVAAGASYPMGFHSFIRREDAETYLSEFDYSWRRLAVVKCEVEEVVTLGVQQVGVDYLNEAPTVVSRRIRILEEVSTTSTGSAGASSAGTKGSVAC